MAQIKIVVAARHPIPGEGGRLLPGQVYDVNDVWLRRQGKGYQLAGAIVLVDEYVKGILRDPLAQLQAKAVRRGLQHQGLDRDALIALLLDGIATYEPAPAPDPLPPAEEPADDAGDDEEVEDDGEEQDEPAGAGEDKPKPKKRRRR